MTPTATTARTASTAAAAQAPTAEQLLRDAAFVLKLTRRVKDDILRSAARPSEATGRTAADRTPAFAV